MSGRPSKPAQPVSTLRPEGGPISAEEGGGATLSYGRNHLASLRVR
jgi:hypothetical protein